MNATPGQFISQLKGLSQTQLPTEIEEIVSPNTVDELRDETRTAVHMALRLGEQTKGWTDKDLGLMRDTQASVFAAASLDRVIRANNWKAKVAEFLEILSKTGVPGIFSWIDKAKLNTAEYILRSRLVKIAGPFIMHQAEGEMLKRLKAFVMLEDSIEPDEVVSKINASNEKSGIVSEINRVVESARSVAEANENINWYKKAIRSGARALAIKPTAILPLAEGAMASKIHAKKLATVFTEILKLVKETGEKTGVYTRVTLDMENSTTFDWTSDGFIQAVKNVPDVPAGIALQAYMPDTEKVLDELIKINNDRDPKNEPIYIRLVKGANLASEKVHASTNGLQVPMFQGETEEEGKAQTDAFHMKLLEKILANNLGVVVGSMNEFSLMQGILLAIKYGYLQDPIKRNRIAFSMLYNMGGNTAFPHIMRDYGIRVQDYVPVIDQKHQGKAVPYLGRRTDEVAASHHNRGTTALNGIGSTTWIDKNLKGFLSAQQNKARDNFKKRGILPNRGEFQPPVVHLSARDKFTMTSNANFAAREVREWAENIINQAIELSEDSALDLATDSPYSGKTENYKSHARPDLTYAKIKYANEEDASGVVESAANSTEWRNTSTQDRLDKFKKVTDLLSANRDQLIQALLLDISKPINEADAEVNEAIDFMRLKERELERCIENGFELEPSGPNGVSLKICPWNFPIAIVCEHIANQLAHGYNVIVKPSPDSIVATYLLCKLFWDADIPKSSLQFIPCESNKVSESLATNPKVEHIGFTGSSEVAHKIRMGNPNAEMIAEAGGKNVVIIGKADIEQAAEDIAHKAMGFSRQKCSGPSFIMLTPDVDYDEFVHLVKSILETLKVGSALEIDTDLGPLIRVPAPNTSLKNGLDQTKNGEKSLLQSMQDPNNPKLYSPGLKEVDINVCPPETWQEIFGPVLHVMKVNSIEEAITLLQRTGSGLTTSVYTQSESERQSALKINTGNLYFCNKPTGALAGIQDFGDGVGDSNFGSPGTKTGTPESVLGLGKVKLTKLPNGVNPETAKTQIQLNEQDKKIVEKALQAKQSYEYEVKNYFSQPRTPDTAIIGSRIWTESRPTGTQLIRIANDSDLYEILCVIFAAHAANNKIQLNFDSNTPNEFKKLILSILKEQNIPFEENSTTSNELIAKLNRKSIAAIRGTLTPEIIKACHEKQIYVHDKQSCGHGRIDLITQYRQQNITDVYHRFGDLGFDKLIPKQLTAVAT